MKERELIKKIGASASALILIPSLYLNCTTSKNLAKKVYNPDKEIKRYSPESYFEVLKYEKGTASPADFMFSDDKNLLSNKMSVLDSKKGIIYELTDCVDEEMEPKESKLEIIKVFWVRENKEKYFLRRKNLDKDVKSIFKNWDNYYNMKKKIY